MTDMEPTVFVVDDDEAVRGSLGLLLKSVGLKSS
ncbi:MAG: DNA-binding response regulator, partial [Gammaproteobacteria bacterium]|nr:DNA-binding response regulator [Gammaproteobacteria bacterium]